MKLIPARCPNCGSNIEVNKDKETTKCEYCETRIIIEDAIAKYKLEVSGNVNINNLPTAKNYLKIGTRSLENGEYTLAHEKLEKALELDADNPDIIIKETLSKVFQNDVDERALDKILYSIKVAVNEGKSQDTDKAVIYCIKQLEIKRKKLVDFYTKNVVAKTGFLFSINKIIAYIKFYEKIFRNYLEDDSSKIYIIRIILSCIQDYCLGGGYIEYYPNGTSRVVTYLIPNETLNYLNEKKEQYEIELAELDEEFREEQEAKKRAEQAAIEEAERKRQAAIEEAERKRLEKIDLRNQKKEKIKKSLIEAKDNITSGISSTRDKIAVNATPLTFASIIRKLLLTIDFIISTILVFLALIFVIYSIAFFNLFAILLFTISGIVFIPYVILKRIPAIKKLDKAHRIAVGLSKYFIGMTLFFIGILMVGEYGNPYENKTFISEDNTTVINISDAYFIIKKNDKETTYMYSSEIEDNNYILIVEETKIKETENDGISELTGKEIARYRYDTNDYTLCLLEKNNCVIYYKEKESQK